MFSEQHFSQISYGGFSRKTTLLGLYVNERLTNVRNNITQSLLNNILSSNWFFIWTKIRSKSVPCNRVIVWQLELQPSVQSVPITTNMASSSPAHGEVYSIQHYVMKFVSDLRQVDGFLRVHRFSPTKQNGPTI